MNHYRRYMDSISLSPQEHATLMERLKEGKKRAPTPLRSPAVKTAGIAACCLLIAAAAWTAFRYGPAPGGSPVIGDVVPASPALTLTPFDGDEQGVLNAEPAESDPITGVFIPHISSPPTSSPDGMTTVVIPRASPSHPAAPVQYADVTDSPQLSADIAYPEGGFQETLTEEQLSALLAPANPGDASFFDGFLLEGGVIYSGEGEIWQVNFGGRRRSDSGLTLSVSLAPGQIPPTCIVSPNAAVTEVNGRTISGSTWSTQGDEKPYYYYEVSFLVGGVGVRVEVRSGSQASAEALASDAARRFSPGLEGLTPSSIPKWRSEDLSLAGARAEADLGQHLPAWVPSRFSFQSAHRELGQERDWLSALWSNGYSDLSVTVRRSFDETELKVMDASRPEGYDVRMYPVPWADSVPEDIWMGGFDDPVFRVEDLTSQVIAARALYMDHDQGDAAGYRYQFSVLYEDGLVVMYRIKGLSPDEVCRMLSIK